MLLAVVSNYIVLSDKHHYYFLNFVFNTHESEKNLPTIQGYAALTFVNLVKNKNLGDRHVRPVEDDLKHLLVKSIETQTQNNSNSLDS